MKSFWVLVSGLCFAVMGVFVRLGSEHFSSAELVFYRSLVGVLLVILIMNTRKVSYRTEYLRDHVVRGVIGCIGLVLYFYVMSILPLAMAVTLNHTAPIFFAVIAAMVLSERLVRQSVVVIGLGFAGVIVLLRPSVEGIETHGILVGLVVGFLVAVGYLYIRHFGRVGEPESRTVFYYSLLGTITAGIWASLTGFHPVSLENVWILIGIGLSATVAQLALTRAYKTGKSILTTTLTYSNVVFASIFGILFWGEVLAVLDWFGIALIVFSGVLASTVGLVKRPAMVGPSRGLGEGRASVKTDA